MNLLANRPEVAKMNVRVSGRGFSLIELLVAVVIVGILAAIAYPSFTAFVGQSRRTDATIALTQMTATLEKFNTTCTRYPTVAEFFAVGGTYNNCTGVGGKATTTDGYYAIAYNAPNPCPGAGGAAPPAGSCYTLTATPTATGDQLARDGGKCATLTIDHRGTKTATGTDGANCWKK
jgi:type IV pilus assembly protein PilE